MGLKKLLSLLNALKKILPELTEGDRRFLYSPMVNHEDVVFYIDFFFDQTTNVFDHYVAHNIFSKITRLTIPDHVVIFEKIASLGYVPDVGSILGYLDFRSGDDIAISEIDRKIALLMRIWPSSNDLILEIVFCQCCDKSQTIAHLVFPRLSGVASRKCINRLLMRSIDDLFVTDDTIVDTLVNALVTLTNSAIKSDQTIMLDIQKYRYMISRYIAFDEDENSMLVLHKIKNEIISHIFADLNDYATDVTDTVRKYGVRYDDDVDYFVARICAGVNLERSVFYKVIDALSIPAYIISKN